jgi:DNA polymerase
MLTKPSSCHGCALADIGAGFMAPQLARDPYGVTLLGEALGADEAEMGSPFVGRAGFRLTRLIEWAGLDRSRFDILNAAWCQPPGNKLEGTPYERPAIDHCRDAHWGRLLSRSAVVVPLGNVPMATLLHGRKGITHLRGYVYGGQGYHVVPTVHPAFIARGQSKYSAAVINDLQKAVELAHCGLKVEPTNYLLDPSPVGALDWARAALTPSRPDGQRPLRIAFDIETPYKSGDESEVSDDDDPTYHILRIGFTVAGLSGMSVPWSGEYIPAIRLLLDNDYDKIAWNAGFDTSRVRANGVPVGGLIHDGMVAWHILHSDLPKGLGFVATFTCPWQSEWKSLSSSRPAYYNVVDADVEWRSYHAIEAELHRVGLWEVYERDVLRIDPILVHMSQKGMPVDTAIRLDRATRLAHEQVAVIEEIGSLIPQAARRLHPKEGFKVAPKDPTGLVEIQVEAPVRRCSLCGKVNPPKSHFRAYKRPTAKRPQNPCSVGTTVTQSETITRLARVEPFKPSREQLIRYHGVLGRPIPTRKDRKTGETKAVFDEMVLKQLEKKYPKDQVYGLILRYREADKLAGTYLGKIEGINA